MTPSVIDASVAVKWCLPADDEMFVLQAEDLLASYRGGDMEFVVPDLFWLELASVLWKAVRKGKIDAEGARRRHSLIVDLEMPTISSFDLVPQTLQLATRHGRTVYDSVYVALALQLKGELITADERLANAVAAYLPVKWLGAF